MKLWRTQVWLYKNRQSVLSFLSSSLFLPLAPAHIFYQQPSLSFTPDPILSHPSFILSYFLLSNSYRMQFLPPLFLPNLSPVYPLQLLSHSFNSSFYSLFFPHTLSLLLYFPPSFLSGSCPAHSCCNSFFRHSLLLSFSFIWALVIMCCLDI